MAAERRAGGARDGERDALAAGLDGLVTGKGPAVLKIDELFGHRPAVLQSIRDARARGLGTETIATYLSRDGAPVSSSAVKSWLSRQGIK